MKQTNPSASIFSLSWTDINTLQQRGRLRRPLPSYPGPDYGADPIGNGQYRMIPSGDTVGAEERNKRLTPIN